jgi:hypothetical protein
MASTSLQAVELCVLFAVCVTGPGLLVVRRFSWRPAEKVAGAIGLSILVIGAADAGVYLLGLPAVAYRVLAGLFVVAAGACWRDIRALASDVEVRRMAGLYAVLVVWMLGCDALIRCFSGGGWAGDWIEHYDRAFFFLNHLPLDTRFIGIYAMPARPPLMNLVAVMFLSFFPSFPMYQVLSVLVCCTIVFPAALFAGRIADKRPYRWVVLLALFAFDPMMVVNATYPWTKLLAAMYVALGAWFYFTGWRLADPLRVRAAVVAVAAGILTHYSVVPYALFFAGHFVLRGSRVFPQRASAIGWMVSLAAALIGPWIGWTFRTYGVAAALGGTAAGGNSTAGGYAARSWGDSLLIVGRNIVNTLVPHQLRGIDLRLLAERDLWSLYRDEAFLVYQTNGILMLGLGGAAAAISFALRRRSGAAQDDARFWMSFAVVSSLIGIATYGDPEAFGVAHVVLQPLAVLGLAMIAGAWERLPLLIRKIAAVGMVLDLALGVALPLLVESRVFGGASSGPGLLPDPAEPTSWAALANWQMKLMRGFLFLGDTFHPLSGIVAALLLVAAGWIFLRVAATLRADDLRT